MGMFDYIKCEVPLPDGWKADQLQTKDFHCEMVEHIISKDGRLMMDVGRQEKKYVDANFHGLVNFCGSEAIGYEPPQPGDKFKRPIYRWHEYNAKFTDGQLVSIETAPDDIADLPDRGL